MAFVQDQQRPDVPDHLVIMPMSGCKAFERLMAAGLVYAAGVVGAVVLWGHESWVLVVLVCLLMCCKTIYESDAVRNDGGWLFVMQVCSGVFNVSYFQRMVELADVWFWTCHDCYSFNTCYVAMTVFRTFSNNLCCVPRLSWNHDGYWYGNSDNSDKATTL